MKWLISFCIFLSFTVHGQSLTSTQINRVNSNNTFMLGAEILSTWLPLKFTGSYTHTLNNKWSFEAEAARGKFGAQALIFDVASVTEYRYSLLARRYVGNSFNWIIGLYKDDFHAKIGSDILDDMSDTSIDDLRVEVVGLVLGLGNRWQWQNGFTFGIDWFRLNAPVFDHQVKDGIVDNIEDENDRDLVKNGIRKVANIPTFVFFGLYFGYSF